MQLDYTSRDKKKRFWRVDGVNDLSFLIFDNSVQHIDVRFAEDKQASCVMINYITLSTEKKKDHTR